jgi:5'-methylthioadenosine phosphorylase
MGRIAVILGSSAIGGGAERVVSAAAGEGAVVLRRHGAGSHVLPHLLDHAENLRPLVEEGCDRVLAIGSVGSLKEEIGVGDFVCPDDFIALESIPSTFSDGRGHLPPRFDAEWRAEAIAAWRAGGGELRDGGVYWQTTGPRFETPAEIRMMAPHCDVVGMTLASECVIAAELGLRYAAVCNVDNMANGIGSPLEVEELERNRAVNGAMLSEALGATMARLAG